VRSASSETMPHSCAGPSAICCGTATNRTDKGESYCSSPIHRGGQ
jgi:hypothetical protein